MTDESRLRLPRVVGFGLLAEVATVLLIIIMLQVHARIVAAGDDARITDFARRAPAVVGPAAGVLFTLIAALLTARPLPARRRAHGFYVGVVTAVLTLPGLFAGVPEYRMIYIAAICTKLVAGYFGGVLADANSAAADPQAAT